MHLFVAENKAAFTPGDRLLLSAFCSFILLWVFSSCPPFPPFCIQKQAVNIDNFYQIFRVVFFNVSLKNLHVIEQSHILVGPKISLLQWKAYRCEPWWFQFEKATWKSVMAWFLKVDCTQTSLWNPYMPVLLGFVFHFWPVLCLQLVGGFWAFTWAVAFALNGVCVCSPGHNLALAVLWL